MRPAVVQQEDVEAVWKSLGEVIDEQLEPLGVQIWSLQEEARPRRRLPRAIDVAPFEDMLD